VKRTSYPSPWGSPLLDVERAVQERAKALALDMARPDGQAALRTLLEEEIRRWSDDFKRGTRPHVSAFT